MLVLTRQINQKVIIKVPHYGDFITIEVMVVDIENKHGGQVRIGFQAPKIVIIDREEIAQVRDYEKQSRISPQKS